MTAIAMDLARWAAELRPAAADLELAQRSLQDTVAVALAAREHPVVGITAELPAAARWASAAHVLDFDDLHMESTAHISAVCVPAVLATGGGAGAYLAGAGVMARLGAALGWRHYAAGWHATCTTGAPAAAVAAGVSMGLGAAELAVAMALAVPAAGGVQRAFGSHAKSLQVGFAAGAGVRAAALAARGAAADPTAVDQWFSLVSGAHAAASPTGPAVSPADLDLSPTGPAVPGGLAVKLHPCCYALQRPISAVRQLTPAPPAAEVERIVVRTPRGTVQPLIHPRPRGGLEGKFSLEYGVAAALLDGFPGFDSFTDAAVRREAAAALVERVEVVTEPGGDWLLAGEVQLELWLRGGAVRTTRLAMPPGAPERPPTAPELHAKFAACGPDVPRLLDGLTWSSAARCLREQLTAGSDHE